jgi:hypothetical protein
MMYLTQQQRAQDLDDADEHDTVGYDDDGLQQQLIRKLRKATANLPTTTPTAAAKRNINRHPAGQPSHLSLPRPLPAGLVEQHSQHSPPNSLDARPRVHDLLDDLLTQAQTADAAGEQQQHASNQEVQEDPDMSLQAQLHDIWHEQQQVGWLGWHVWKSFSLQAAESTPNLQQVQSGTLYLNPYQALQIMTVRSTCFICLRRCLQQQLLC